MKPAESLEGSLPPVNQGLRPRPQGLLWKRLSIILMLLICMMVIVGGLFVVINSYRMAAPQLSKVDDNPLTSLKNSKDPVTLTVNGEVVAVIGSFKNANVSDALTVQGTINVKGSASFEDQLDADQISTNSLTVQGTSVLGQLRASSIVSTTDITAQGVITATQFTGTFRGDGSQITSLKAVSCQDCVRLQTGSSLTAQPGAINLSGSATFGSSLAAASVAAASATLNSISSSTVTSGSVTADAANFTATVTNSLSALSAHIRSLQNQADIFTVQTSTGETLLSADSLNQQIRTARLLPATPSTLLAGSVTPGVAVRGHVVDDFNTSGLTSHFMTMGTDGFPRIVKQDSASGDVMYVRCLSLDCSAKSTQLIENVAYASYTPLSIALDQAGHPYVSYGSTSTGLQITIAHCLDDDCASVTKTSVALDEGAYSAVLEVGSDGFAGLLYDSNITDPNTSITTYQVNFLHCLSADCTTNQKTALATSTSATGGYSYIISTMTVGSDGLMRVLYFDNVAQQAIFVRCQNLSCSSRVTNTVGAGYLFGTIALTDADLPRIVTYDGANANKIQFYSCTDIDCSAVNSQPVTISPASNYIPSMVIGADGKAHISFANGQDIVYIKCLNDSCSVSSQKTVAPSSGVLNLSAVYLGPDNLPRILYTDIDPISSISFLSVATFASADGTDIVVQPSLTGGTAIGSSIDPFGTIYGRSLELQTSSAQAALNVNQNGIYGRGAGPVASFKINGVEKVGIDADGKLSAQTIDASQLFSDILTVGEGTISGSIGSAKLTVVAGNSTADLIHGIDATGEKVLSLDSVGQLNVGKDTCTGCTPTNIINTYRTKIAPLGVTIRGNYMYLTGSPAAGQPAATLSVYDVSNPKTPVLLTSLGSQYGEGVTFSADGHYMYVATTDPANRLEVYDMTNPALPVLTSSVGGIVDHDINDVAISGQYIYAVERAGLEVYSLSNPAIPSAVTQINLGATQFGNNNIEIYGNTAYILNSYEQELSVVDITNPAAPTLISTKSVGQGYVNSSIYGSSVGLKGHYLYIAHGDTTPMFEVLDVADPHNLVTVGSTTLLTQVYGIRQVVISGNIAYVKTPNTIELVDITDPIHPVLKGTYGSPTSGSPDMPYEIAVNGSYVYGIGGDTGGIFPNDTYLRVFGFNQSTFKGVKADSLDISGDSSVVGNLKLSGDAKIAGLLTAPAGATIGGVTISKAGSISSTQDPSNNLRFEEPTTNYINDPTFANGLGFGQGRGTGTVSIVTGQAGTSTGRAVKIVPNNDWTTINIYCALNGVGGSNTFTISFIAWAETGSQQLFVLQGPYNFINGGSAFINSTPTRYSYTWTRDSCNSFEIGPPAGTTAVYIADVQVEQKDHATNFATGSMGYGYTWQGAANNSFSVRNGGTYFSADATIQGTLATTAAIIKPVSGTADLIQAQDSTGTILAKLDYQGNLTVKSATISGTLTVNGHIVTANLSGTTSATVGANAGTGATTSVVGNDTSGTVTVTTGTGPTAGILSTINFASAYGAAPRVVLTPATANGTTLQYFYNSAAGSFTLRSNNAPTASTAYAFTYYIVQ